MMRSPTRKALLVANGRFSNGALLNLKGPRNDVRLLRQVLTGQPTGLYAPSDVEIVREEASHQLSLRIEQFLKRAGRDDELLLYYSGHGQLSLNGDLYLCASDTVPGYRATAVASSELSKIIDDSSARVKVIVLDCCYAGAFKGDLPVSDRLRGHGRFVLTSSQRGQLSPDAKARDAASPFTALFAEALQRSELDRDRDGFISVDDVCDFIAERGRAVGLSPGRSLDTGFDTVALARAVPKLEVQRRAVSFGVVEVGSPPPRASITLANSGGGRLRPRVQSVEGLLVQASEDMVSLTLDTARPRRFDTELVVSTDGGARAVRVSGQVVPRPRLQVEPPRLDLGVVPVGHPVRRKLLIVNAGGGDLRWEHLVIGKFLRCRADDDGLVVEVAGEVGQHAGAILVSSNGGDRRVEVHVMVVPSEAQEPDAGSPTLAVGGSDPADAAIPVSQSPVHRGWRRVPGRAWPVQPSEEAVRAALSNWARQRRGVRDDFFERDLILSNESLARLDVARLLEVREENKHVRSGGSPRRLPSYDDLEAITLPFTGWTDHQWTGIQRGSVRTSTCDRCKGVGRQRCVECRGRGLVSCSDCYGADKSCRRCGGGGYLACNQPNCAGGQLPCVKCDTTGSLTLYVEGRVSHRLDRTVIQADLGHLMEGAAAYYRMINRAVGAVDLSDIPFSERVRVERGIPPREANELDRKVELSVLPVVGVRYVDDDGQDQRAYLVGEDLAVHAPGVRPRWWRRWHRSGA